MCICVTIVPYCYSTSKECKLLDAASALAQFWYIWSAKVIFLLLLFIESKLLYSTIENSNAGKIIVEHSDHKYISFVPNAEVLLVRKRKYKMEKRRA